MKTPWRKFTSYELQMLASKGDKDYDKYKVSTTFHEESEEEEEEEKPKKVYKPPDIIGKDIDVKFYSSGKKSYVVDKSSIKRRKKSSGTFYEGNVVSYDKKNNGT
jgi:hypothetical protein